MARLRSEMLSVVCAPRCCAFIAALKDLHASIRWRGYIGRLTRVLVREWNRIPCPGAEPVGYLAQFLEHLLFLGRGRLLFVQNISSSAIPCAQAQHVLASETRDRALYHCSAYCPLTDFGRNIRRKLRIRGPDHQAQCFAHARIGKHAEVRGFLKLARHYPAKRTVECRIPRGIREIGENNGAFVCRLGFGLRVAVRERPDR